MSAGGGGGNFCGGGGGGVGRGGIGCCRGGGYLSVQPCAAALPRCANMGGCSPGFPCQWTVAACGPFADQATAVGMLGYYPRQGGHGEQAGYGGHAGYGGPASQASRIGYACRVR